MLAAGSGIEQVPADPWTTVRSEDSSKAFITVSRATEFSTAMMVDVSSADDGGDVNYKFSKASPKEVRTFDVPLSKQKRGQANSTTLNRFITHYS